MKRKNNKLNKEKFNKIMIHMMMSKNYFYKNDNFMFILIIYVF